MKTGMMWLDNTDRAKKCTGIKVREAAARYRMKYGFWPNTCNVHPSMMDGAEMVVEPIHENGGRIVVRPWRVILPGNLWIGMEEAGA